MPSPSIETREDLEAAAIAFRAFYRLRRHQAGRPSYPLITWDLIMEELKNAMVPFHLN